LLEPAWAVALSLPRILLVAEFAAIRKSSGTAGQGPSPDLVAL